MQFSKGLGFKCMTVGEYSAMHVWAILRAAMYVWSVVLAVGVSPMASPHKITAHCSPLIRANGRNASNAFFCFFPPLLSPAQTQTC